MVDKPGRRKKESHAKAYITIAVIAVLIAASTSYAYSAGLGPFGKGYGTGSSTSGCVTTTVTSITANSSTPAILYAQINTTEGAFDVELFYSLMPTTVTNFVHLVDQGFYNELVWHRIVPGFVIQTGDPTTKDGGGSRDTWGYTSACVKIPFEDNPSLLNDEYYLAMASTGEGVGGSSQFYINLANNTSLNGNYAVFGKVINGTSVVNALGSWPTEEVNMAGGGTQQEPVNPVYVISIRMISAP